MWTSAIGTNAGLLWRLLSGQGPQTLAGLGRGTGDRPHIPLRCGGGIVSSAMMNSDE